MMLNKIAVAFNEAAARLCESSGSEHSSKDSIDLSDLVSSFFDCQVETHESPTSFCRDRDNSDGYLSESETKRTLLSLLGGDDDRDEDVKQIVREETQRACEMMVEFGLSEDFKRQLMSHLRHKGFDAGLCKSRWEKLGRNLLSGNYEYVDVNINGTRYIIEVNLAEQFEIARPTTSYTSLLEVIQPIFVGEPKVLKRVVKLMCNAMKNSMKTGGMHLPPWRRNGYMQSKWFARYKRTVNEIPVRPTISFRCKDNFGSNDGFKVGYLAAALDGTS
ncbi:hypothetical protein ERO13_D10G009300v2 [Gossypium hirsutum]|uniref:Uncharacterized protein n=1 Tax=Gossypium hirsutum TaxID=3635 RepID=A0A1U8LSP3_GOSHI|nr:uncharacterized protein LOC107930438 [Gossypium hirsutum]KAG4123952.1 hypothetical protein ERO13_D10G009300v2 [Gossypium hirsutum]